MFLTRNARHEGIIQMYSTTGKTNHIYADVIPKECTEFLKKPCFMGQLELDGLTLWAVHIWCPAITLVIVSRLLTRETLESSWIRSSCERSEGKKWT